MNHGKVAAKLLFNGLRYRCLRMTGNPSRLQAISLEVTHRCICRCRMCNIWRIPGSVPDLDLSAWTGLLASPELKNLRELDITGGEPFLRDDLGDLLTWICRMQPECFPELRTVAVTTNGILTEKILGDVQRVIVPMQALGIDLVLALGMDGVGEIHDRIRNTRGAWRRLRQTLQDLKEFRTNHPNLVLGIKTTVVPMNVDVLEDISAFAREHGLFTIISPRIITANRFGNTDLSSGLDFGQEQVEALKRFFRGPEFAWSGHRRTLMDYLSTGLVKKGCSAGFNTVFVRHNGEVFPCPIISFPLGNIQEEDLGLLLRIPEGRRFRRLVGSHAECLVCTEPGMERIAWPFEGFSCLRTMMSGRREFVDMLEHMGLDKYF